MKKYTLLAALVCILVISVAIPCFAQAATVSQYEIYPTPHVVIYGKTTCDIPLKTSLYASEALDDATLDRAYDAIAQADVLAYSDGETRDYAFYFGIYGSGDAADKYFEANADLTTAGLFDKTDSYYLAITKKATVVLGKDTNAVFYGLTTLKMIFKQVQGRNLRLVTIEDWSDSLYRGFIEGYYGIPWTTDERVELMRFGGEFKTNIYIYAPKNDPYHSTNWRSLYKDADLAELKEQIEAGERSKTRFAWAAHPFNHQAILPSSYQTDIAVLLAKFEQLYTAGVRQFVVSADDVDGDTVGAANRWNTELARDILNDVAKWCKEKGDCYNVIFVPNAYYTMANPDNADGKPENYLSGIVDGLDETVEIMWTGHNVCSYVSNGDFDKFTQWTDRKAFMWMNWPVNDYADGRLIMSKAEIYDVKYDDGQDVPFIGIVTNPMQYAEADKFSVFATADYTWNTSGFNVDKSYDDSFKYVEENCVSELRELCSHLSNATPFQGKYFEESKELAPYIDKFFEDYSNGDCQASANDLKLQFNKIYECGQTFLLSASNRKLVENIRPYVEALQLKAQQCRQYISVLQNYQNLTVDELKEEIKVIEELGADLAECKTPVLNKISYDHEPTTVEVGIAVINQFIKRAEEIFNEDVKPALGMTSFVYKGFSGIYQGRLENVFDGDENTFVWFNGRPQSNASLRICLGELTTVSYIKVLTGKPDGGDTWKAIVEYSVDGKNFTELQSISGASAAIDLRTAPIQAKFIRLRDNGNGTWVAVREVILNQPDELTVSYGNIELESSVATSAENMIDGDISTFTWFSWNRTQGAYVQLAYSEEIQIRNIQLLMAKKDTLDDYFPKVKLSYSLDGLTFTDLGEYTGRNIYVTLDNAVAAKFVRATAAQTSETGVIVRDFSVNNAYAVSYGSGFKPYDYVRSGHDFTHVSYAADNDPNTFLDLEIGVSDGERTITLDLFEAKTFSQISIVSGGLTWADNITRCSIEYSSNGTDWTALDGEFAEEDGTYLVDCNVAARYVRITVINGGWITLREISVK